MSTPRDRRRDTDRYLEYLGGYRAFVLCGGGGRVARDVLAQSRCMVLVVGRVVGRMVGGVG